MNRKWLLLVAALLAATVVVLTTPAPLRFDPVPPALPEDVDAWLAGREALVDAGPGIVEGAAKRIRWQPGHQRTPLAVVHLHGFSASRQETAPLADLVADALGANLFETRLAGHGLQNAALEDVRAEDWLADATEALAIGAALGERVVILSTSTGATLAAAMLDHPGMAVVDTIVMISPNFAPRDARAQWLTGPAGFLVARIAVGPTRSWQAHNDLQARYWTTRYPTRATVEVMRLVARANHRLPGAMPQRLLMFLSDDDAVISAAAALSAYEGAAAPAKALIRIDDARDPSRHVLAGDILSPTTTGRVAAAIVDFIARRAP